MTPPCVPPAEPHIDTVEVRLLPSRLRHGLILKDVRITGERPLPSVRIGTVQDGRRAYGFGEAPPLPSFTGYDAARTVRDLEIVAPHLRGRDLADALDWLHDELRTLAPPVRCALDLALHDLRARARGLPLDRLLGRRRHASLRISRAIGFHDLDTTVALARRYRAAGLTALKLKVGRDTATDAAAVLAVRRAVGPEVELAVDANESLDAPRAVALARACAGAGLAYFEQPVPRHDHGGLRAVRAAGVRVMADESVFDADDVRALAAADAADLIAIKLVKTGGLRPALSVAEAAGAHGLPVVVIDPLGSAVSLQAGLALAVTLDGPGVAHGLSGALDVTAPHAPHAPLVDGRLPVSDAPGLGVQVDWPVAEGAA